MYWDVKQDVEAQVMKVIDYAHYVLNKFDSLSVTVSYNTLPLIIFNHAFHTSSTKPNLCTNSSRPQYALSTLNPKLLVAQYFQDYPFLYYIMHYIFILQVLQAEHMELLKWDRRWDIIARAHIEKLSRLPSLLLLTNNKSLLTVITKLVQPRYHTGISSAHLRNLCVSASEEIYF